MRALECLEHGLHRVAIGDCDGMVGGCGWLRREMGEEFAQPTCVGPKGWATRFERLVQAGDDASEQATARLQWARDVERKRTDDEAVREIGMVLRVRPSKSDRVLIVVRKERDA